MPKRDWNSLSPTYRARLTRGGINRAAYESGASLRAARGHSSTPEHPSDLITPGKSVKPRYQPYVAEHQRLVRELQAKKERVFGNRIKFNRARSEKYVSGGVPNFELNGKPSPVPGNRELKRILAISDEDLDAYIIETEDKSQIAFLYYH